MKAKMSDTLREILDCDIDAMKLRQALDTMGDLGITSVTVTLKGQTYTITKVKRQL